MKIEFEIPDFDGNGIDVIWEINAQYALDVSGKNVCLRANKEGLISLGKQMLYLAYSDLASGDHVHYDGFFTQKNAEDYELTIERK